MAENSAYLPPKLVANGSVINLGRLGTQINRYSNQKNSTAKNEKLAFGLRFRGHKDIARVLTDIISSKNLAKKYTKLFSDLEVIAYYENDGSLVNIELLCQGELLLELSERELDTHKNFRVEIGSNHAFWKKFHELFLDNISIKQFLEKPQNTNVSHWWYYLSQNIQTEFYKFRSGWEYYKKHKYSQLEQRKKLASLNNDIENTSENTDKMSSLLKEKVRLLSDIELTQGRLKSVLEDYEYAFEAYKLSEDARILFEQNFSFDSFPIIKLLMSWKEFDSFHDFVKIHRTSEIEFDDDRFRYVTPSDENPTLIDLVDGLRSFSERRSVLDGKEQPSAKDLLPLLGLVMLPITSFEKILRKSLHIFSYKMSSCHQIGPFREQPPRVGVIDPDKKVVNVGMSGENILNILNTSTFEEFEALNEWLARLEIGYSIEKEYYNHFSILELKLKDSTGLEVSINDVGYGISQVLPVIVQCCLLKGSFITIEQPELHIHPRLQANLADLFVWSAETLKNDFLIETHSEHIILRLQRRQRETENHADYKVEVHGDWNGLSNSVDISVVEKADTRSHSSISTLQIDSKGEFTGQWPGGFFEERFEEIGLK